MMAMIVMIMAKVMANDVGIHPVHVRSYSTITCLSSTCFFVWFFILHVPLRDRPLFFKVWEVVTESLREKTTFIFGSTASDQVGRSHM